MHLRQPNFQSFNWKQRERILKLAIFFVSQDCYFLWKAYGKHLSFFGFSCLKFSPFCFLSFFFYTFVVALSIRWNDSRGNCRKRKCSIFNSSHVFIKFLDSYRIVTENNALLLGDSSMITCKLIIFIEFPLKREYILFERSPPSFCQI